ncbi:hypothetical protein BBJ28_00016302 [Nothophytophthora sp. Chile5]|nr:hypothetical protein BBJ28_00016302 [Nothophytophthora sp. Chile5]
MDTNSPEATKTTQLNIDVDEHGATRRVSIPMKRGRKLKDFCTGILALPTIALLLMGLGVYAFAVESSILPPRSTCAPAVLDMRSIKHHSDHRYYSTLKNISALQPPIFSGKHAVLCDDKERTQRQYSYCLPISGRKDTSYCAEANRMDLLLRQSPTTMCYASVLHLLLVEVYEELQALDKSPIIAFGSLLGAVRNGSVIPFTEDADIAYSGELRSNGELQRALWRKGYHMFFMDIWRVCVAPTHPLAANLYDPSLPLTANYDVPYLDLYAMKQRVDNHQWEIQEFQSVHGHRTLPDDKVTPFSQVTINGQPFDTVHDPKYFLEETYGADYMTPRPRGGSTK